MLVVIEASVGWPLVTVDEGIAPPASASEPCVRVSTSHGSSVKMPLSKGIRQFWAGCQPRAGGLVTWVLAPLPDGLSIHRDYSRVHGLFSVTDSDHLHLTVPTSAYPAAFPQAFASWGIPPRAASGWHLLEITLLPFALSQRVFSLRGELGVIVSTARGYFVPHLRLVLNLGSHSSPGF